MMFILCSQFLSAAKSTVKFSEYKGVDKIWMLMSALTASASATCSLLGRDRLSITYRNSFVRQPVPVILTLGCRAEANAEGAESDWAKTPIGRIAKGAVHDVKDYGVVCDLEANPDVVGLAATHQVILQGHLGSK